MTEYVSRSEFAELMKRLDTIDAGGTRGVAVVAVQLQEVAKDVAKLETAVAANWREHRIEHQSEENARVVARRWLIAAFIAAVAAVDGPVVSIVLARGR